MTERPEAPLVSKSLGETAISGARWTGIARFFAESTGFASIIVTSRLLSPAEVGHAAVAILVVLVAVGVAQQGFGSPLVRKENLLEGDCGTTQTVSFAFGVVAAGLVALFAMTPVTSAFGSDTQSLLILAAFSFPLAGLGAVPMASLQRSLNFRRLALIDGTASVIGGLTTLTLAGVGVGSASLVIGPMTTITLNSLGCTWSEGLTKPAWNKKSANELWRFGLPTAASSILYILNRNVDYAILAARIPATQVGYYFRAYQLGSDYQSKVSAILLRMALPLFSRATSSQELRKIRNRMTRVHTVILFPFLVGLIGTAPHAIPFLFGPKWAPAVVPTQILTVAGMVSVVGTGSGPLLTAAGYPKQLLYYSIGGLAAYAATVYVLVPYGVVAVCIGVAVNKVLSLIVLQVFFVQRLVGIPARDVWLDDIVPSLSACIPLLFLSLSISHFGAAAGVHDGGILLASVATGALVYALTLRTFFREAWNDVSALAGRARPTKEMA